MSRHSALGYAGGSVFSRSSGEHTRRKGGRAQPGKLLHSTQVGEEFNGSLGVGKRETLRGDWVNRGTFQKVLEKS